MIKRLALAAVFALVAVRSEAALSVSALGIRNVAASATSVLTTSVNDCPVGSLIILEAGYVTTASTLNSVVDSAGNTWRVPFDNTAGTGIAIAWAYAVNSAVDLPIGGTITATFAGSTASETAAYCVTGADLSSPLDVKAQTATGTSATTATTVNSGTLSIANEILFGGIATAAASGTVTCNNAYSRTTTANGTTPSLTGCTKIVSATTTQAFAPSWVNANNYASSLISFRQLGTSTNSSFTFLGIGP